MFVLRADARLCSDGLDSVLWNMDTGRSCQPELDIDP